LKIVPSATGQYVLDEPGGGLFLYSLAGWLFVASAKRVRQCVTERRAGLALLIGAPLRTCRKLAVFSS